MIAADIVAAVVYDAWWLLAVVEGLIAIFVEEWTRTRRRTKWGAPSPGPCQHERPHASPVWTCRSARPSRMASSSSPTWSPRRSGPDAPAGVRAGHGHDGDKWMPMATIVVRERPGSTRSPACDHRLGSLRQALAHHRGSPGSSPVPGCPSTGRPAAVQACRPPAYHRASRPSEANRVASVRARTACLCSP